MKIVFYEGVLHGMPENEREVRELLELAGQGGVRKHRQHKMHMFKKECSCGKVCKGRRGLAIHQAKCKRMFVREPLEPKASLA